MIERSELGSGQAVVDDVLWVHLPFSPGRFLLAAIADELQFGRTVYALLTVAFSPK